MIHVDTQHRISSACCACEGLMPNKRVNLSVPSLTRLARAAMRAPVPHVTHSGWPVSGKAQGATDVCPNRDVAGVVRTRSSLNGGRCHPRATDLAVMTRARDHDDFLLDLLK